MLMLDLQNYDELSHLLTDRRECRIHGKPTLFELSESQADSQLRFFFLPKRRKLKPHPITYRKQDPSQLLDIRTSQRQSTLECYARHSVLLLYWVSRDDRDMKREIPPA